MRAYTVTTEQFNEDRSDRFVVYADSQDRAWSRAHFRCAYLNQAHGTSHSPVEVVLSQGEDQ